MRRGLAARPQAVACGARAVCGSRRFRRPRPPGLGASARADGLCAAFAAAPPSEKLYRRQLKSSRDRLAGDHDFPLSALDLRTIEYVYRAFFTGGPELR